MKEKRKVILHQTQLYKPFFKFFYVCYFSLCWVWAQSFNMYEVDLNRAQIEYKSKDRKKSYLHIFQCIMAGLKSFWPSNEKQCFTTVFRACCLIKFHLSREHIWSNKSLLFLQLYEFWYGIPFSILFQAILTYYSASRV